MANGLVLIISGFDNDDDAWQMFDDMNENTYLRVSMVNGDHPGISEISEP